MTYFVYLKYLKAGFYFLFVLCSQVKIPKVVFFGVGGGGGGGVLYIRRLEGGKVQSITLK